MDKEEKESKRTLRKIIFVIAIFSTYIVVFLLGRITNIITLGIKEKNNDVPVVTSPVVTPSTQNGNKTGNNEKHGSQIITEPIIEPTTPVVEPTNPTMQPTTPVITPANPTVQPTIPVVTPTGEEPIDNIIRLVQKSDNKDWKQIEELSIFNSHFYQREYQGKIAPGFYGIYEFYVENYYENPVTYVLSFNEENSENINIVYKVMNYDNFILGSGTQNVYLDGVKLEAVTIPAKSKTLYKLVWKWEDTDYDTQIGTSATARYKLNIDFNATIEE